MSSTARDPVVLPKCLQLDYIKLSVKQSSKKKISFLSFLRSTAMYSCCSSSAEKGSVQSTKLSAPPEVIQPSRTEADLHCVCGRREGGLEVRNENLLKPDVEVHELFHRELPIALQNLIRHLSAVASRKSNNVTPKEIQASMMQEEK